VTDYRFFELAIVLVCLDHIASGMVNLNHCINVTSAVPGRLSLRRWCNRRCYCRSRSKCWCRCGGPQLLRDSFGYLSPDRKVVSQFAIKRIGPKMQIVDCVDQLHVHPHRVGVLLHASFQDVGHAQLLGDLRRDLRRAFVMLRGSARDYLQIGDLR
jgi:hypothetical protein